MTKKERDEMYEKRARAAYEKYHFELRFKPTAIHTPFEREEAINNLPKVKWKGRDLVTLVCSKCGCERNVPKAVPWCLITLDNFRCSWCAARG